MQHTFTLTGDWTGGLRGQGTLAVGGLASAISVPTVLGGPGAGTNPEELLTAAASSCYLITLAAIVEGRKRLSRSDALACAHRCRGNEAVEGRYHCSLHFAFDDGAT